MKKLFIQLSAIALLLAATLPAAVAQSATKLPVETQAGYGATYMIKITAANLITNANATSTGVSNVLLATPLISWPFYSGYTNNDPSTYRGIYYTNTQNPTFIQRVWYDVVTPFGSTTATNANTNLFLSIGTAANNGLFLNTNMVGVLNAAGTTAQRFDVSNGVAGVGWRYYGATNILAYFQTGTSQAITNLTHGELRVYIQTWAPHRLRN